MDTGTKYAATINPIKNEFAPSFLNKRYIARSGKNKYTLYSYIYYMKVDADGVVSDFATFGCTGGGGSL